MDTARASTETVSIAVVEGQPTPIGVPTALLASSFFLATGGPARVALALAKPSAFGVELATRVVLDVASGIEIAMSVGAPVLAASVVVEVSAALIARAASPAQIHALLAPLRSFAILSIVALIFQRMASLLILWASRSPQ